jgi:uncharacterized Fe-S cluster-containing radical SAM superfamily protein
MSNLCYLSWLAHRGLGVEHILIISVIWRVSYWRQELTRFYGGVRVAHLLSFVRCRIMCLYFLSSVL